MSELPHGLTDPLHLLEPFPWRGLVVVALVAAVALMLAILRRRRQRARSASVPPPEPVGSTSPAAGIFDRLERLRRRHEESATFRSGCHELSGLLRGHLESVSSRPFSRWTAREAARAEGDTVWTRLLGLLSDLQFGRRPPDRSDLAGICDLARAALSESPEP